MHVEDMRGDGSINLDTVASRLEDAGKRVNENDHLESDLSRTINSMSKRDKSESGRLMLRVIPWL